MVRGLCLGDSWEALADALAGQIQGRGAQSLESVWVVVPSAISRHWILRQLAERLDNDLAGVAVMTLQQLAFETFRRLGRPIPTVTEDKRYLALVWENLHRDGSTDFVYPQKDPYPTVRRLYEVLRELRDAGLTDDEAAWLSGEEPYEGLPERQAQRARRMMALYHRYLNQMKLAGWVDGPEMMLQAGELLGHVQETLGLPPFYLWGFSDLIGVQKIFLKALASAADAPMTILLPKQEATAFLREELLGWGFKENQAPAEETSRPQPTAIVTCPNPETEAWAVAKQILDWRRQGAGWSDCAVIVRSLDTYRTAMERAFTQHHIPFVMAEDPAEVLGAKATGAAIKAALAFWQRPSAREAIWLLSRDEMNLDKNMTAPVLLVMARLLALPLLMLSRLKREGRLAPLAKKLAAQEDKIAKDLKEPATALAEEWTSWLLDGAALSEKASGAGLAQWLSRGIRRGRLRTMQAAMDHFFEMVAALPSRVFSSRHFAGAVIEEMAGSLALETSRTMAQSGGVWFLAAHQARGASFKHVFLCGASDQAYPRLSEEDPYLGDAVRERLNELGFGLAPGLRRLRGSRLKPSSAGAAEEQLLFDQLIRSSRDSLVASCPQLNAEGRPVMLSPYLSGPNTKAKGFLIRSHLWEDRMSWLETFFGAPGWVGLLTESERRFCRARGSGSAGDSRILFGMKREEWARWRLQHPRLTPTTLGNYLSCPQAYWMERIAKLPGLAALPRGEFFSAPVLGESFSKALTQALQSQACENLGRYWQHFLKEEFSEIPVEDLGPSERYKLGRMTRVLDELGRQIQTTFIAAGNGNSGEVEAEKVLSLGGVLDYSGLECRADIVIGKGSYWELKLKRRSVFGSLTGKRSKPKQMLLKLLDPASPQGASYGLQVLFYLLYAKGSGGGTVTLVSPYWEIVQGSSPPVLYSWDVAEAEEFKGTLKKWAGWFNEGMRSGEWVQFPFWPHESQSERCDWCAYRSLCGKDIPWIRTANLEAVRDLDSSFEALKEATAGVPPPAGQHTRSSADE